jgi:hypothetical protein
MRERRGGRLAAVWWRGGEGRSDGRKSRNSETTLWFAKRRFGEKEQARYASLCCPADACWWDRVSVWTSTGSFSLRNPQGNPLPLINFGVPSAFFLSFE